MKCRINMHDRLMDTPPFILSQTSPFLFLFCRFVFKKMFPFAPKMPFPQWQLSKRSWWQRCWPQEWTRRPLTNIFSSFVESLEKEVSSLKKSHICKTHPKNAVQLYPCLYPPIPTPHIFLFYKTCQRAKNVNCVLSFSYLALLLLAPALYFNSVQPM